MNQIIPLHRGSFKSEREAALNMIDTAAMTDERASKFFIPAGDDFPEPNMPAHREPVEPLGYRVVLWVASVIGVGLVGALLMGLLP